MMDLYGIFGAGGFAKEVIPLAAAMLKRKYRLENRFKLVFISEQREKSSINHYPVLTPEEFFLHPALCRYFTVAIANYINRKRIAGNMQAQGAIPFEIRAENHVNLQANTIGEGAIFCPFSTITAGSAIGRFFHANCYACIAHDCIIGDFVTFAPNVHCNGNVIVEEGVYAGTGVIIRQGTVKKPVVIGRNAVLGMGAVVTKSVPPDVTVIGNPARIMKKH